MPKVKYACMFPIDDSITDSHFQINDKILDEEKDLAECLHSSERLCRGDAQEIMSSVLSLHSIKR